MPASKLTQHSNQTSENKNNKVELNKSEEKSKTDNASRSWILNYAERDNENDGYIGKT